MVLAAVAAAAMAVALLLGCRCRSLSSFGRSVVPSTLAILSVRSTVFLITGRQNFLLPNPLRYSFWSMQQEQNLPICFYPPEFAFMMI